jgi:ubiquinone/menaquinone biosynthesis C-methylase UbiE
VRARVAEMERLQPGRGQVTSGAFWDERARRFAKGPMSTADRDPMLARLRRAVGPASTVLDVGSGPGRFTIAIAPRAREVVAVDPSPKMLQILRRRARDAGVRNVRTVVGLWQDVDVAPADVTLCSYVLTLVDDPVPFLTKLDAATRRRVFLYLGAFAVDAMADPFWRHFHGQPRKPGPSWVDALDLLAELGVRADVEVVEVPTRARYRTLEEAVDGYLDSLALADTAETRRELSSLLEPWLQRRNGALWPPLRTQPAAILSWVPGGSGAGGAAGRRRAAGRAL